MKMTLTYNLDDFYHEGIESIYVKRNNYSIEVKIKPSEECLSINDLHNMYYDYALQQAAFDSMFY